MADWIITDQDIESTEKLLLPDGAHFADDAKNVIRFWESTDVAACPGSGKTTVLLAKLKLLADRMPLENGAGICVLSHTNVAVDEIKKRLSGYADKLLGYPNFIGTIQSFVDRFVTMPYLRGSCKTNLQFVNNEEYGRYLYNWIWRDRSSSSPYYSLRYYIRNKYSKGGFPYAGEEGYYQNITIGKDGIYHGNTRLAGFSTNSGKQYLQAIWDLLVNKGILRYGDTYMYANMAIDYLSEEYTDLFSNRFKYVFVDEYQDCDNLQRAALGKLFNEAKCCVIHIGDLDQAIYNGQIDEVENWIPCTGCMTIASSCRYTQEIANILVPLRKNSEKIISVSGSCGYKPVLIIFDENNPTVVVDEYRNQIVRRNLNNGNETHYAIGFRREASSGLTIGSYWEGFDSIIKSTGEIKYWPTIDDICLKLNEGKLYRAEKVSRRLIYAVFRDLGIKNLDTEKPYTHATIHEFLKTKHKDFYADYVYQLSMIDHLDRKTVEGKIRDLLSVLLDDTSFFDNLSSQFLEDVEGNINKNERNVCCVNGIRIKFDTIHAVKGKTHSSTLYLETEYRNGSDLGRILHLYGARKNETSQIYDYSRKIAYVGMSRPRNLLCVAMRSKTFDKSKGAFNDGSWEIIDLRTEKED